MGGTPSWAESSGEKKKKGRNIRTLENGENVLFQKCLCVSEADEDEDDEDEDLLRRTGNFVASSDSLPRGVLRVSHFLSLLGTPTIGELVSLRVSLATRLSGCPSRSPHCW